MDFSGIRNTKNILSKGCDGALYKIKVFLKSDAFSYIVKYNYILFIIITIINIFAISISINELKSRYNPIIETIDKYPLKYNNYEYFKLISCNYVYVISEKKFINVINETESTTDQYPGYHVKNRNIYMPMRYNGIVYYIDISDTVYHVLTFISIVYIIMVLASLWFTYKVLSTERLSYMFSLHGKETALQHEILFNIVSNINHEVTSPLLVLKSGIDDIKYELTDLNTVHVDSVDKFVGNVEEILILSEEAVNQIYDSLRALSDYKSVRFSNGDKNIYDLCDVAVKMISRTNIRKFNTVYIDEEFKKYSVYHENNMTNAFFLNILINHIKNSLEAGASSMKIYLVNKNNTHLHIAVSDNGSGIPEDLQEHIFELDVTTKAIDGKKRGAGLYLNKLLLTNRYEGDDVLIVSKPNIETTFALKIRYEPYKLYTQGM